MSRRRVLVTGGAGFVGSQLAIALAEQDHADEVIAFDNLSRRGSEKNLLRLREAGVVFVHGDVRSLEDLMALPTIDALVECSAEPSVLAGVTSSPDYLVRTNLLGAYHCLELARRDRADVVFLSTSRVYPVAHLRSIALVDNGARFDAAADQSMPGITPRGVSEDFPLVGARTLYGATKLSAEHLVEEYRSTYSLRASIVRFGVIAGPWQMGKVDQGVFTYWVLSHMLNRELQYIGYSGSGMQVRDVLYIADAVDLIMQLLRDAARFDGLVANAGGGLEGSLSLKEATIICEELTQRTGLVRRSAAERPGDIPFYVSDNSRITEATGWVPTTRPRAVLAAVHEWITQNEPVVDSLV